MSEPLIPEGMYPLLDGDRPPPPLTRFVYRDLPGYPDARAFVLTQDGALGKRGTTVMVVRPGLARRHRQQAVREELGRRGAWQGTAWVMGAADAARRALAPAQRMGHALSQFPPGLGGSVSRAAVITVTATAAAVTAAGGAAVYGFRGHPPAGPAVGSPAWHRLHPVHVHLPPQPLSYLGVYEPTSPRSYAGVQAFAKLCGREPNLALYYSGWGEPFAATFAAEAAAAGAVPVVQWNPETAPGIQPLVGIGRGTGGAQPVSLAAIAAGNYDPYLVDFADAVASYGRAVVISFGPEVNGTWYPWSAQPPGDYIAAWRHIEAVFTRQGAQNVTWMWTVNRVHSTSTDLARWWPGGAYVYWVGVDGYYRKPRDTWSFVFAPTIGVVRQFTAAPILVAETAIGPPGTEPAQLADMYTSIRDNHYLGLIWFDEDKPGGLDYRLEGDKGAIAVFRQETAAWRLEHQRPAGLAQARVLVFQGGHQVRHDLGGVLAGPCLEPEPAVLHHPAAAGVLGGGASPGGEKPPEGGHLLLKHLNPVPEGGDLSPQGGDLGPVSHHCSC